MPDVEVAESSPAPILDHPALTPAVKSGDFAAFEREERTRETSPTKPAASSPALAVEQPASTDATPKPASELAPAAKAKSKETEDRIKEGRDWRARAEKAERELEALSRPAPTKPAESSPAPAEPKPAEFPDYADYLADHPDATLREWSQAHFRHMLDQQAAETAQRTTAEALDRSFEQQVTELKTQFDQAKATDPAFMEKLDPDVSDTKSAEYQRAAKQPVTPANIVTSELLKSSIAPQLSLYFSEHKDEWTRLQQVPDRFKGLPPLVQAREHIEWIKREVGRIEGKLEAAATAPASHKKTTTSAPSPATTLGTRPTAPLDAEAEAMKKGDFAAVEKIWREQDAAKHARR